MNRDKTKHIAVRSARTIAAIFLLVGILLGAFALPGNVWTKFGPLSDFGQNLYARLPYRLGLDIQGGTHLVYQADLSKIAPADYADSMESVRNVIERRVNLFGVAEPLIQVEKSGGDWRLIVELAGIKDINSAIKLIGATPYLEFKSERLAEETKQITEAQSKGEMKDTDPNFIATSLTGRHIKGAQVTFDQNTYQPQISLELNDEGTKLFQEITKNNVGKRLAIYLDGLPISAPVIREEISGGKAQITGNFTPEEAKTLVGRLNAGALPVPVKLVAQQTVQSSLGRESLQKSLMAGAVGFLVVALFMLLWYRLPGFLAVLSLMLYAVIVLGIFKLIPVTLTMAGIAGFILSIGMAVDANILIFERFKEELKKGKGVEESVHEGFGRAWTSIRDSNISSLLTCAILYWLGTSVVKGFALTLAIGILVSMFSAISVTRTLLFAVMTARISKWKFLFIHTPEDQRPTHR